MRYAFFSLFVFAVGCRPAGSTDGPVLPSAHAPAGAETKSAQVGPDTRTPAGPTYKTVLSTPCAIVGDGRTVECNRKRGGSPTFDTQTLDEDFGPDERFVHIDEAWQRMCGIVRPSGEVLCWEVPGDNDREATARPMLAPIDDAIDLGMMHEATCGLTEAGVVRCWGKNDAGQLGDGSREPHGAPVTVELPEAAVDIEAHYDRACALLTSGVVHCWGGNTTAGDPRRLRPTRIRGLSRAVSLESIHAARLQNGAWATWETLDHVPDHGFTTAETITNVRKRFKGDTCWLDNKELWCTTGRDDEPEALLDEVLELDSASAAYCVRRADGAVWCLGRKLPLINPPAELEELDPTQVPGLSSVLDVAVVTSGACAVHDGGQVSCWGDAPVHHAWNQQPAFVGTPGRIPLPGPATAIVATPQSACALVDGHAHCWGTNAKVMDFGAADSLTTRADLACASSGGKLSCLQNVTAWHRESKKRMLAPDGTESGVSDSGTRCQRKRGGVHCQTVREVLSCPKPDDPQALCTVTAESDNEIVFIQRPPLRAHASDQLLVGGGGACALSRAGRFRCTSFENTWARFSGGHIEPQDDIIHASAGFRAVCAVREGGEVACWGNVGAVTYADARRRDPGIHDARSVHVGGHVACAVRRDQTLWCWGDPRQGARGLGGESWDESWRPIRLDSLRADVMPRG